MTNKKETTEGKKQMRQISRDDKKSLHFYFITVRYFDIA